MAEFIDLDEIEKIAESWGIYSDERGLMSWRLLALVRAARAALRVHYNEHGLQVNSYPFEELTEALAPFRKEAT